MDERRARTAVLTAALLALGTLLCGCTDWPKASPKEFRAAMDVDRVLASRPREPLVDHASAVFDPGTFTTTYGVQVRLGDDADQASMGMSARWEGPNCGESGVIVNLNQYQRGVMVQERGSFSLDPALFSWTHPHPPCTADATHGDVTVKVTITNPSGALVCSFKTAQTSEGTCVDPPRAPLPGATPRRSR